MNPSSQVYCTQIIDSILDYSKLEASGQSSQSCVFALADVRDSGQIGAKRVFGRGEGSSLILYMPYILTYVHQNIIAVRRQRHPAQICSKADFRV